MTAPPSAPSTSRPLGSAADEYFDALYRADEARAVDLALDLLAAGACGKDVLLGLVAPAQDQVGTLWQTGEWSVAQEHAATCIAERVVAAVASRNPGRGGRGHVVLACLDGEWHALAARILAEVLRLHDWKVTFLGASVPPTHLVSFLHHHGPDVVALSAALPIHLPAAHRTIVAAQRTGTPVLVGGPGFGEDGRWARRLAVDAWAPTADDAVGLLESGQPWPEPVPETPDGAWGVEYAGVRERRGRLVTAAARRLQVDGAEADSASVLSDSPLEDDLAQLADFLAAAAYLDDRPLFTAHVGWLEAVARHRGDDGSTLPEALDAFRRELHDFPFAQACVDDAQSVLGRRMRDGRGNHRSEAVR